MFDYKYNFSLNITLFTIILILIPLLMAEISMSRETFSLTLAQITGITGGAFLGFYWSQRIITMAREHQNSQVDYYFISLIWHELKYNDTILVHLKHLVSLPPSELLHIPTVTRKFGLTAALAKRFHTEAFVTAQQHMHTFSDLSFNEIELAYYNIRILAATLEEIAFHVKEKQELDIVSVTIEKDIAGYIRRIRDELTVTRTQIQEVLEICQRLLASEGIEVTAQRFSLMNT